MESSYKKVKGIGGRKNLVIPVFLASHNPATPRGRRGVKSDYQIQPGETIELENKFGPIYLSAIQKIDTVSDTDMKNLIAVCNVFYDAIHSKKTESTKLEEARQIQEDGLIVSISDIIYYRDMWRCGKAYTSIIESMKKLTKAQIRIPHMRFYIKGSKREIEGTMNLLQSLFEIKDDKTNSKSILIGIHGWFMKSLRTEQVFWVDKNIFNELQGIASNLFIFFSRENLKKLAQKTFSLEQLFMESHCSTLKSCRKPSRKKELIIKALNQMVKKRAIINWEAVSMKKTGEEGVKVIFHSKKSS